MDSSGDASFPVLDDDQLQSIYVWVDSIPLSRPKRNISRDFSDGVLLAEILAHYFPRGVELHNYSAASSVRSKLYNWATLNQKALKRIGYEVSKSEIDAIVNCKPGVIEYTLFQVQRKIAEYRSRKGSSPSPAPAPPSSTSTSAVVSGDAVLLAEKDATIAELRETVDILELKIKKLEQLVRLKDSRIATLDARLRGPAATPQAAAVGGVHVIPAGQ